MIAHVSFMIAKLIQIRLVRYQPQRHQLPVRPLLQPVLQIPVSWSCTLAPTTIMISTYCIQMTVSLNSYKLCVLSKKTFRQCVTSPEELLLSVRENQSLDQMRQLAKCVTSPKASLGRICHCDTIPKNKFSESQLFTKTIKKSVSKIFIPHQFSVTEWSFSSSTALCQVMYLAKWCVFGELKRTCYISQNKLYFLNLI